MTHQILALLGKPASLIKPVTDRPGHDRRYALDSAKIGALGWAPAATFDAALSATVELVPRPRGVVEADQVRRVPRSTTRPSTRPGLESSPPAAGGSGIMRGEVVGMGRSGLTWIAVALLGAAFSTVAPAAPRDVDRRLEPSRVSPLPSQVRRVEPAIVGIRVEVESDRPSAATLGTRAMRAAGSFSTPTRATC